MNSIIYKFPGKTTEAYQAFYHLQELLGCRQSSQTASSITLTPLGAKVPLTVFQIDGHRKIAAIHLRSETTRGEAMETPLPDSFFTDTADKPNAITLAEATEKLVGKINAVDHTGIEAPDGVSEADWDYAVTVLSDHMPLYIYPEAEEYDPKTQLWLFGVPDVPGGQKDGAPIKTQPKFELASDDDSPAGTVLQIDMETKLTRDEIKRLFPDCHEKKRLGQFFLSVDVESPWPGIAAIRLDLRPKTSIEPNEFNTGEWLRTGQRITGAVNVPKPAYRR